MNPVLALILLLLISAVTHILVGRVVVRPLFDWPHAFHGPIGKFLLVAPYIGYALVVLGAFVWSENGWKFLFAAIFCFIAFSVKPHSLPLEYYEDEKGP